MNIVSDEDETDAPQEYFDMMGRKINAPQTGSLYIVRQGTSAKKVVF